MAIEHDIKEVRAAIAKGSFDYSAARAWERVQSNAAFGAKASDDMAKIVELLGKALGHDPQNELVEQAYAIAHGAINESK